MTPTSDTQRIRSDADLTALLWTAELGWLDTEEGLRSAARITAEEKLAKLAEALEVLPDLVTRLVEMSERISEVSDRVSKISGRTDWALNASDPDRTVEIFDGSLDTQMDFPNKTMISWDA